MFLDLFNKIYISRTKLGSFAITLYYTRLVDYFNVPFIELQYISLVKQQCIMKRVIIKSLILLNANFKISSGKRISYQ